MPNLKLIYEHDKHAFVVWNQVDHGEFWATFYDADTALEFMHKFLVSYINGETKKG